MLSVGLLLSSVLPAPSLILRRSSSPENFDFCCDSFLSTFERTSNVNENNKVVVKATASMDRFSHFFASPAPRTIDAVDTEPEAADSNEAILLQTFPDELVEDILIRAWLSTDWSSPKRRWFLYRTVLGLSRQWNRIMRAVVMQFRVLESLADFQMYSHLSTSFMLQVLLPVKYIRIPFLDLTDSYLLAFHMIPMVQSSAEVDIPSMSDGDFWRLCKTIDKDRFRPRHQSLAFAFKNYAVLSHNQTCDSSMSELTRKTPKVSFITGLTITWTKLRESGGFCYDLTDFKCMLLPFPNLAHLRTNIPISLLLVSDLLKSLVTLTLDIPPLYIKDFHATSLLPWSVITSLKKRAFVPQKIIVESGPLKPIGWDILCNVCDTLGVKTLYIIKYASTYEPPIKSPQDPLRSYQAASSCFNKLPLGDKSIGAPHGSSLVSEDFHAQEYQDFMTVYSGEAQGSQASPPQASPIMDSH
ncbi:hypothetical protein EIP91_006761 [Steccherinum ochraceum]|uniref:F-box domain-containing protein n=1 Tax=Steccherinum ochraceum TaxID=92696 RepID=A0A4R0RJR2_9APHY|nr:hypothetical protein EIP91_006761 [Steccherinum ochraceum]